MRRAGAWRGQPRAERNRRSVGQGWRSCDETGGTCAKHCLRSNWAGTQARNGWNCRGDNISATPIHPYRCPSTMLEACVAGVRGNGVVRQDRMGLSRTSPWFLSPTGLHHKSGWLPPDCSENAHRQRGVVRLWFHDNALWVTVRHPWEPRLWGRRTRALTLCPLPSHITKWVKRVL